MKPREPKFKRGAVMLDDEYCRLYIVVSTRRVQSSGYTYNGYRCLIVADWSTEDNPNHAGQFTDFGDGVEEDVQVGYVELPANM